MPRQLTFGRFARERIAAAGEVWAQIWFQPMPTAPLELARIGIGAALLLHYGMATPYLFDFWGDAGLMPRSIVLRDTGDPWAQSVFFYFTAPWQWIAFHGLFLVCCAAFMAGWRTSWVKWIVLIGQLSYDRRNPALTYGVDWILASLLLILCLAPIGRAMSLDRVRAVRAAKRGNLGAMLPQYRSPWTGACIRLIQIQMAVLFFYSAVTKIARPEWVDGSAVWTVFTMDEYYSPVILKLLVAGQYRDLRYDFDRARISILDLAGAHTTLLACGSPAFARAVCRVDASVLFLVRHDDGSYELRASRMADTPGLGVETQNGQHGDDLRWPVRLLCPVDDLVPGIRRPEAGQDARFSHQPFAGR